MTALNKNYQASSTGFWIFSIIAHTLVLALLIWLLPAEALNFEEVKKKKKVTRKDDKLERVVEQIRDIEADKLRQRIDLLAGGTDRMRVNRLNIQGRHQGFENAQKSVAFKRIREQLDKARQLIEGRKQVHANYRQTPTSDDDIYQIPVLNVKIRGILDDVKAAVPLLPKGEGQDTLMRMVESALGMHFEATRHVHWMMGGCKQVRKAGLNNVHSEIEDVIAEVGQVAAAAKESERLGLELEKIKAFNQQAAAKDQKLKDELNKRKKERNTDAYKSLQAEQVANRLRKSELDRLRLYKQTANFIDRSLSAIQWAKNALDEQFDEKAFEESVASEQKPFTLVTKADEPSAPMSELLKQDLVDLFDTSDRLITQLTIDYRTIKAIQLAELRDMSVSAALDQIQKVAPLPTEVDKVLLRDSIRDPELFDVHKAEVEKVKASVEEKISLAERLLLEIEAVEIMVQAQHQEVDPKTLEEILAQKTYDEEEIIEAAEYEEQREELTAEMQELMEQAQVDEREPYKDIAEQMKKVLDVQDLTKEAEEGEDGNDVPIAAKDGGDPRLGGERLSPDSAAVLARKISNDGLEHADWMFVDTWYTIGPFPNEMRRNIHTQFPPETIVDLDATYSGKGGAAISWEFIQSRQAQVIPANPDQYAIYYAYTEIHMDEACDMWVAVGSDDKANVWINDMPIWISGDALKGWNISEGFRKVHFKKGKNKVLYRIENGWLGVAFSLCLYNKLN